VHGEREELGTEHVPKTEARLVPGAFGDPFRIVEALPCTAPWLSGLPYLYVCGSPPESVGYSIDGVPVPLLFHVGAGPSILAPALVDSVDLYPGAYPAQYGRYAGAVIAGATVPADTERAHAEVDARVFDASALGETPTGDHRGSVLAAGRYSYTGPLISLIAPDYGVGYWDYQFRASHSIGERGTLTLFAFGAEDKLEYRSAPLFRIDFHRFDLRLDEPLGAVGAGRVRVAATAAYDDTLTAPQTNTGAGSSAALRGPSGRLRVELDQRMGGDALLRAGGDFAVRRFEVDQYRNIALRPHTDLEGGLHGDLVWRPLAGVELVPGVRLDAYRTRDRNVVAPQPRVAAKIHIAPRVAWISALGVAHQEPTEEVFVPAKLPSRFDEESRTSYQFSEGLEFPLPDGMRARATAFASRVLGTAGAERNAGIDLFLRRDFTHRLGGFVSYTLARSEGIPPQGGTPFRTSWDRTHVLSVVLGYDFGGGVRLGGRAFFESGRPYQLTCPPDCAGPPGPARPFAVSGDLPPFFRLDARLEKKWNFSGERWLTLSLECFNVFDRAEPTSATYSPEQGLGIVHQSPIILPSIGIEAGL
jgi:hypothetical protein